MPDRRYVRPLSDDERLMITILGRLAFVPRSGRWGFVGEMQRLAKDPKPMIVKWQAERLRALVWECRNRLPAWAERLSRLPIGSFRPVSIPSPREEPAYGYDD